MPSHPLYTVVGDIAHNQQSFSGQELVPEWMTPGEKAANLGLYLWRQAMPSLLGSWSYDKLAWRLSAVSLMTGWAVPRAKWEAVLDAVLGPEAPQH
jgi:hypothetical protein